MVRQALRRGIEFLLEARWQGEAGALWWRDFELHTGASDEWVSAYTACALLKTRAPNAHAAAIQTWRALEQRSSTRDLGFGYNRQTSSDADSTIWACRLGAELGATGRALASGLDFLNQCRRSDGGVSTYPSESAVRRAILIPADLAVDGWTQSHPCVTAAAGGITVLQGVRELRRYLMETQDRAGEWTGYWWCDREYTTALAIESLKGSAEEPEGNTVSRAAASLIGSWFDESSFRVALRSIGLRSAGMPVPETGTSRLLELQQSDGGWPSSARLRIPFPYEVQPDLRWDWTYEHKGFGSVRLDQHRTFTTATAVWALSSAAIS